MRRVLLVALLVASAIGGVAHLLSKALGRGLRRQRSAESRDAGELTLAEFLEGFAVVIEPPAEESTWPRTIRRKSDDALMRYVPPGRFRMGCGTDEFYCAPGDERPHEASLYAGFYMDVCEVTNRQFARFVAETSWSTLAELRGTGWVSDRMHRENLAGATWRTLAPRSEFDDRPVVLVAISDATRYAAWAGASLPTETQFEFALRGGPAGVGGPFPWGASQTPPSRYANFRGQEFEATRVDSREELERFAPPDGFVTSAPVGSFPPNALGIFDLAGNVAEWCVGGVGAVYEKEDTGTLPVGSTPDRTWPCARGGSWYSLPEWARSSWRHLVSPEHRADTIGFRLARSTARSGSGEGR
jgi:sulfatase modifying factor 1